MIDEEFLAWWNAEEREELRKSCAMGWCAYIWKASRAALCVESPARFLADDGVTGVVDVFESVAITRAIESQGVRTK